MRTIRFRGGASMGGHKYTQGDTLTGPENDLAPLVDVGTAEWADEQAQASSGPDATAWAWSVSEARTHVAEESDEATLRAWHAGEVENPGYPGGRKGVRDAIEERLGELGTPHAAEGLSRGPEA